jgi:regulatory protein
MYKITALQAQKRNNQRVNVYLDGEFAFGLARIVAAWLQIGQEISDDKIKQLQAEDALEVAYQRAIKFISYRSRSTSEVRKNLQKHDTTEENIELVLQRLIEHNLLNDANFARTWVENRSEFRPRGRRALEYELRQHGIDAETIEKSLESINEEELAYQAAQKKVRQIKNLEFQEFRQKMYRYLAQRGFSYETISTTIDHVWSNSHTESPYEEEEVYP